jgi:hypothetical protein
VAIVAAPYACGPGGAACSIVVTVPSAVCTNATYGKVVGIGAYTYTAPSLPKFTGVGNLLNPGAGAAGAVIGVAGVVVVLF